MNWTAAASIPIVMLVARRVSSAPVSEPASSTTSGASRTAVTMNAHQYETGSAGAEARQHLVSGAPENVGIVETRGQHAERDVEGHRHADQQDRGGSRGTHAGRSDSVIC